MLALLSLLLSSTTLLHPSVSPPDAFFPPTEKLTFSLNFIDTNAGEAEFETLPTTTWEGHLAHHFRATVKTIGLIRLAYPYNETVDLYFDREKNTALFVDINIQYGDKKQHTQIRLDGKTLKGEEIEDSEEPGEAPHHRIKGWKITPGAQSLFSIVYFLRTRSLAMGDKINFPVSHDEKNATFDAEVVKTERIETPSGDRDAVKVRVSKDFANAFFGSVSDEPLMWFNAEGHHELLRFEFLHRRGRLTAKLKHATMGS